MSQSNRRKHSRIRIDRSVKIPVQLFPVMPFIGEAISMTLINLSSGGMALVLEKMDGTSMLNKKREVKVHFRLPGRPLQQCRGIVTHVYQGEKGSQIIGIRFLSLPAFMTKELQQMATDTEACDRRLREEASPWCIPTCSFHSLCRKPIRIEDGNHPELDQLEIALQEVEDNVLLGKAVKAKKHV